MEERRKDDPSASIESQIKEAQAWVARHGHQVPAAVVAVVTVAARLFEQLEALKSKRSQVLTLLRMQMGLEPKSERGQTSTEKEAPSSKPELSDEERLRRLRQQRSRLNRQIRRYEDRLGYTRKKRQKKAEKKDLRGGEAAASDLPVDSSLAPSDEQLFCGGVSGPCEKENQALRIDRPHNFENPVGLHASSDDRKRYEYGVSTKEINLKVETVTDLRTGKSVTASTDEIGPPNSQATWKAISNTIMMVMGYAVPVSRLAKMLEPSCPYFTSARLCSFLDYAAELFAPVYEHLGEALADADWLLGDDTKARVVEVDRKLKEQGGLDPPPSASLIERMSESFGRVFKKKRGDGTKRQLNVSVVIAKTEASDRRSHVFFFRTHLGSLGDLLTKLLEMRDPKRKHLTLVSDLAATNLVSPELRARFHIKRAGCAAHARRPFFRYKKQDVDLCYWMLSAHLVLTNIEERINEVGRREEVILRFRQKFAAKVWEAILKRCQSVLAGEAIYGQRWPKGSKLYEACRYVVDHYEALTCYLHDARLPLTNNLSERVLRWEKIMQDASKFRMTERGRLNVDILRTIVHTCSAAEVDLQQYLYFVFKNRKLLEDHPDHFTPYAFALKQDLVTAAAKD